MPFKIGDTVWIKVRRDYDRGAESQKRAMALLRLPRVIASIVKGAYDSYSSRHGEWLYRLKGERSEYHYLEEELSREQPEVPYNTPLLED